MMILAKNDENIFDGGFLIANMMCNIFNCISMMEVFCESSKRLLALKYFRKKAPPYHELKYVFATRNNIRGVFRTLSNI